MVANNNAEARIAIIADMQRHDWWEPRHVRDETTGRTYLIPGYAPVISTLQEMKPDRVILAGDVIPDVSRGTTLHPDVILGQGKALAGFILQIARVLPEADVYVLPGSHETVPSMVYAEELIKHMPLAERVRIIHTPHIIPDDVHGIRFPIAFLPGSTTHPQSSGHIGYHLEQSGMTGMPSIHQTLQTPEGFHLPLAPRFASSANLEALIQNAAAESAALHGDAHPASAAAYDPTRMLIVSHIPPRDSPGGIDEADVYVRRDETAHAQRRLAFLYLPAAHVDALPPQERERMHSQLQREGWARMKKSAGLQGLRRLIDAYKPLGIVSGHIEEASGRAHTYEGDPVPPRTFTSSLELNASGTDKHTHTLYLLRLREEHGTLSIAYEPYTARQIGSYTLIRRRTPFLQSPLHKQILVLPHHASQQPRVRYTMRG